AVWERLAALQERRPGGFTIAALMRPPARGEDEAVWLGRAREAESRGPLGLHTHWTAPDHARPTGGDPAALVSEQANWLRSVGHGYFHDTDLLDPRRSAALRVALTVLGRRRKRTDLRELQRGLRPEKTMSFAKSRG